MADDVPIATWIALGVAIWGAVLATYTAVSNMLGRGDRIQIQIHSPDGQRLRTLPEQFPHVMISLVNRSDHVLYVSSADIRVPPIGDTVRRWPFMAADGECDEDHPIQPRARLPIRLSRAFFETIRDEWVIFPDDQADRKWWREFFTTKTVASRLSQYAQAAEHWQLRRFGPFSRGGMPGAIVVTLSTGKVIRYPKTRGAESSESSATSFPALIRFQEPS